MQSQSLVFEHKQHVDIKPVELPDLGPTDILVKAICSLMSTGTEGICFNRHFAPSTEFSNWVQYPFFPGYSWVGQVLEVGSDVIDVKVGDRIGARKGHASHHVIDQRDAVLIPDAIDSHDAAWFALAKIAGVGARGAGYHFGSKVAIIGAGPIGQMSTRWAAASGAEHVVVIDPVTKRLDMAIKGGATAVIGKPVVKAKPILEAMLGCMPDIVIDSTGSAPVFV